MGSRGNSFGQQRFEEKVEEGRKKSGDLLISFLSSILSGVSRPEATEERPEGVSRPSRSGSPSFSSLSASASK